MAKPKNPNKPKTYIIHSQVNQEVFDFVNQFAEQARMTKSQAISTLLWNLYIQTNLVSK